MSVLTCDLAGLKLDNPTVLASGIMGSTKDSIKKIGDSGAAAVTIKSITKDPRPGHNNPQLVGVESGYLNAVGYTNMGLQAAKIEFSSLDDIGVPVIASIVAEDACGFKYLAEEFNELGFSALELALSCPHTPGMGTMGGQGTSEATSKITSAVRDVFDGILIVKLSPNIMELGDVASAAVDAGCDVLNMGNTLGPGMVINLEAQTPVLGFKFGGMSGPAVKPITIRCVYDVYKATSGKTPIIATGGITCGEDVIEAFMAGASACGVGTAIKYRGIEAFKIICDETRDWMEKNNVGKLSDIWGVCHG